MRPSEFRALLQERPFRPLRVTLTDGRTYDIVHPEFAMVGRGHVVIGLPRNRSVPVAGPIFDRAVTVSLLHVMQIEPVKTAPSPPGS